MSKNLLKASVILSSLLAGPAQAASCGSGSVAVSSALQHANGGSCVGGSTNPIYALLDLVLKWLTGLFFLILVFVVVAAGLRYVASAGNPDGVKQAKSWLSKAFMSVVAYALMLSVLKILGINVFQ